MKISGINTLVFSPAGHTGTIVSRIASAWSKPKNEIDLSDRKTDFSTVKFKNNELCLVGVPSFGGRVPAIAAERLRLIHGQRTPAVLVVSYGNRAFDDTLLELKDILTKNSFRPLAAVAAVAEHTICPQFATGRPDRKDQAELLEFGEAVRDFLEETPASAKKTVSVPGSFPYREFSGVPMNPSANGDCVRCGLCARKCPVGAISPEKTARPDPERCITCMRCVAICPKHARSLPFFKRFLAGRFLRKACSLPRENELFLP